MFLVGLPCRVLTLLTESCILLGMTQILIILEALAIMAITWGGPIVAVAVAFLLVRRSRTRYHVGNPKVGVPVETFRTKQAAREASMRLYKAHGRCFRITTTR